MLTAILATLAIVVARAAHAECPPGGRVTAFFTDTTQGATLRFAVVAPESALVTRPLAEDDVLDVAPLAAIETLNEAVARLRAGTATCADARRVRARDLASPIDGRRLFAPITLPELGLVRGATHAPSEREARLGRVVDLATWKDVGDARPPVRADAPVILTRPEGRALALELSSTALGARWTLHGPIVAVLDPRDVERDPRDVEPEARDVEPDPRDVEPDPRAPGVGRDASALRDGGLRDSSRVSRDDGPTDANADAARDGADAVSALVGAAASVRRALDDRTGALAPGDVVSGSAPGLGAISVAVAPYGAHAWAPPDQGLRFAVAHGAAVGLSLLSIGLSFAERQPACVVSCDAEALGLPGDRAFAARVAARTDDALARSAHALDVVELAALGVSLATVLAPSGRRGVLSRVELLEDVLVLGEGWLVGWTMPLTLQARLGRARPRVIARGGDAIGRGDVTAPLFAPRTTAVAAVASAATSLLVVEEASAAWVVPAAVVLGGLTAATAYLEVRAGDVFPSDVPLALVGGAGSGLAVVLWHALFWRDWPGDGARGALPLRLVVAPSSGAPSLALTGAF